MYFSSDSPDAVVFGTSEHAADEVWLIRKGSSRLTPRILSKLNLFVKSVTTAAHRSDLIANIQGALSPNLLSND
jgi:hypothetical protein